MKRITLAALSILVATAVICHSRPDATAQHTMLGPYDFEESGKRVPRFYEIDGTRYTSIEELKHAVTQLPPGSKLLLRGGCEPDDAVELGPRPYMSLSAFKRFCRSHQASFEWHYGR